MMGDDGARARCGPAKTGVSSFTAGHERKSEKNCKSRSASLWGAKTAEKNEKNCFWWYKLVNIF